MTRVEQILAAMGYNVKPQEAQQAKKEEKIENIFTYKLPENVDYSSKADRKARQQDLKNEYASIRAEYKEQNSGDTLIARLTNRQAGRFAKAQLHNEQRYQKYLNTETFLSKSEYDSAVAQQKAGKAYQGKELTYIKNENVQQWVRNNPQKFYENGKFSSEKYKAEMAKWVGTDYKMNLDEKSALSAGGDRMTKKEAKKAAQYAGIDVEKDTTWLKKAGAFFGTEAGAAGIGAVTGYAVTGKANFNSYVDGKHQNGQHEILGEQHSSRNAKATGAGIGALSAALGALPLAIYNAAKAKDNGAPDVFQNSTAERIVKDPDGIKNVTEKGGCRTLVRSIMALPNLTENEKIAALEYAYGKNTGKTVNKSELVAAYQAAKELNDNKPAEEPKPTEAPQPQPTTTPQPTETTQPTAPTAPSACYDVEEEKGKEPTTFTVRYGDYPSAIISGMYGVRQGTREYAKIRNEVYKASGYERNTNLRVGQQFTLPDVQIGDKTYKADPANKDKVKAGRVVNNGLHTKNLNKVVKAGNKYYVTDCQGKRIPNVPAYDNEDAARNKIDELRTQK